MTVFPARTKKINAQAAMKDLTSKRMKTNVRKSRSRSAARLENSNTKINVKNVMRTA